MNGTSLPTLTAHPLSMGGSIALLLAFELLALASFFISAWAWGRMIRREPAGTLFPAACTFGFGFGLLTLAPAGIMTWYVCGANADGLASSELLMYLAMTIISPVLVYYPTFKIANSPLLRVLAHGVFTTFISQGFGILVSHNGPPGPLAPDLFALQWMGLLMVFNSWETHGWAYVERVPADGGLIAWTKTFIGQHRSNFIQMLVLWHFYLLAGEVVLLNYALSFTADLSQIAPLFRHYAGWVREFGAIHIAAYSLAAMSAVMMAVFIATMSHTRQTRDVALTEQNLLETNLRMINARYAAVLKNAPYAVLQFDRSLRVDVENDQATKLLASIAQLRQAGDGSLPLPSVFLDTCRRALQGNRASVEGELPRHGSDTGRWYRMICEPVTDALGHCVAVVAVLDDQTERNQRETELKQLSADAEFARAAAQNANLAKSRFLANMSHEIRTPMNGLYSSIQLLGDARLPESKRHRVLDTMKRSADSMIKLLNDILDLSKVEAGALKLKLQPVMIHALGHDVLNLFQAAAHAKQLDLQMHCDLPADERLMCDELRIQQMLSNLMGNAIKFTPRGRIALQIVKVQDSATSTRIRFSVVDSGPGISATELRTVFNAYHQLENQTAGTEDGTSTKGTGLGLTIVKHLAELMQGTVGAESTPGVGSVFWFEIPLDYAVSDPLQHASHN